MTVEDGSGFRQEAGLCISCCEVYGIVIKHEPSSDWQYDSIEVMIEDRMYHIHRCPPSAGELPFFNVRILEDES
jgi:hypothetical protein